jgi:hypothetical protein
VRGVGPRWRGGATFARRGLPARRGTDRRFWRARARGARRRSVRLRMDTKVPEPAVASGQSTFAGTLIRVLYRFGRFRNSSQASDLGIPRQGHATRPSNRNEVGGLPTCFRERSGRFRFLKPAALPCVSVSSPQLRSWHARSACWSGRVQGVSSRELQSAEQGIRDACRPLSTTPSTEPCGAD